MKHLLLLALLLSGLAAKGRAADTRTQNVILITTDGLRWQEVFGGVDVTLMDKDAGGIKDLPALTQRFQRETARESREALMPFFWRTLAQQGVVFGDPEQESKAVVTNGLNFSYPGYSEILCGFADPLIDSNAKKDNVNVTVLEWLKQKPGFENSVAAFCSWDVFPFIINETRSGIPVNAGWEPLTPDASLNLEGSEAVAALRELASKKGAYICPPWASSRAEWLSANVSPETFKKYLSRHRLQSEPKARLADASSVVRLPPQDGRNDHDNRAMTPVTPLARHRQAGELRAAEADQAARDAEADFYGFDIEPPIDSQGNPA